jgi:16S rRNA U516 pseudouridylate synthase RsuA-like enzyme
MKNLIQQYYAVIDQKVCTATFTTLWLALKNNLGNTYLDLKLEDLCKNRKQQLLSLIPQHLTKGKSSILSIQLTNTKIEELRKVFIESGLGLLKLVRIPIAMKEQELAIPKNIMRDLF